MFLATDAQSRERTMGSYMLTACDRTQHELIEFAQFHGRSHFLLNLAMTYDAYAAEVLNQYIFNTYAPSNVSEMRNLIYDKNFVEICSNMTTEQRTNLTLKWAKDTAFILLTIDAISEKYIFPSILQVNLTILPFCNY